MILEIIDLFTMDSPSLIVFKEYYKNNYNADYIYLTKNENRIRDLNNKKSISVKSFSYNLYGECYNLTEDDKNYEKKSEMLEDIMVSFGGRIAEEMILGADNITGGASADIKQATRIAERMVTMYGFSEKLGEVNYERKRHAGESYQLEGSSDETLKLIDEEIKRIITEQKAKAEKLLKSKKKDLIAVAEALLKYETLDKEQVEKIIKGEKIEDKTNNANDQKLSILNLTNNTEKQEETDDFVYDKEEKVEKTEKKKIKKSATSTKTTKIKKKKVE